MISIRELMETRRVLVCCGAGGVGKTTTAASIALAAARAGKRVLVLTIDPSKRLAEALGVSPNLTAPVPVSERTALEAGIRAPGSLDAWMLDPAVISEQAVRKLARSPEELSKILSNRLYQGVSQMLAGMQEYTAMKALHRFVAENRYDLIVLDTPPSRHALDFLESPGRVAEFLEGRVFKLFVPAESGGGGLLKRAASSFVQQILSAVFGPEFAGDIVLFFGKFGSVLRALNQDLSSVRERLKDPSFAAFLLVTSSGTAALEEAFYFQAKTLELGLPFRGFLLNRTRAGELERPMPLEAVARSGFSPGAVGQAALDKLQVLAEAERAQALADQELLGALRSRAGREAFAEALPWLPRKNEGTELLLTLGEALVALGGPCVRADAVARTSTGGSGPFGGRGQPSA
jgi:anion-transporting  ArsA/GET3 family ATPase